MSSKLRSNYHLKRVDLTIDEVVYLKWNKLAVRMFEKKLTVSERNFIKRLRKRERNTRKYETDLRYISADIQALEAERNRLQVEKSHLRKEIYHYQELFFYDMHSSIDCDWYNNTRSALWDNKTTYNHFNEARHVSALTQMMKNSLVENLFTNYENFLFENTILYLCHIPRNIHNKTHNLYLH